MKALFHGVIADQLVRPYPTFHADERDNVKMILQSVRRFCEAHVDPARMDAEQRIPDDVLAGMKQLGLFGMSVPTEYGGIGLSTTAFARVIEEIASIDASLALTLGAHQSLGAMGILLFGTEAQKQRFLPRIATGERVAAFALSEPGAGSDAAGITTRAELDSSGEGYRLTGVKSWVSNGAIADVFTVFARTAPGLGGNRPRITAFFVERQPGVRCGAPERKLGMRANPSAEVTFDDVPVSASNVIGEVGRGFRVAMEVLNLGRLSMASGCVGACKRLTRMAMERAEDRRAFGRAIVDFELIQDKLAWMMSETWALESMTYLATGLVDARVPDCSLESAICKVFGAETLWRLANEALQIAGGAGCSADLPYERFLRDARINTIFEGTNDILRLFIALSGIQGPSRALDDVSKAIREPIKGFGLLSDFAVRKARTAFGREHLHGTHPSLQRQVDLFEDYAAELARAAEKMARRHGKELAERQMLQKRLADMAIDLFAIAACLSRTTQAISRRGEEGAVQEVQLTTTFIDGAQRRLAANLAGLEVNDDRKRLALLEWARKAGGYRFDIMT